MPTELSNQQIYEDVLDERRIEKNERIKAKMNLLISKIEFAEKQKKEIDNKILELNNNLERLKDGKDVDLQKKEDVSLFFKSISSTYTGKTEVFDINANNASHSTTGVVWVWEKT